MPTPQQSREAAANLVRKGYPHGRRMSKGLSNIPAYNEIGSAAYRRMLARKQKKQQDKNS